MYSYNFEQQLDQRRLTILLLSRVISTDTNVLKDIYEKKQKLEIQDINKDYKNTVNHTVSSTIKLCHSGEYPNVDVCDTFTKKHRMLLRQIRCLQPGFIVYEMTDYSQDEYDTTKCINLKPLTQQTEMTDKIPPGIKIVNRIFKEYEKYNPDKVDEDYRAAYLQDRVEWADKLGSGDDPENFQITGDQRLNKTFDKRQQDFNNMCIMGYDNNNQFQYSIVVSEMLYYIFMCRSSR